MLHSLFHGLISTGTMPLVSFLLTYLCHGTIMLGALWLLGRSHLLRSFSLTDLHFKTALLGRFATTLAHVSFDPSSLLGRWNLPTARGYESAKMDASGTAGEGLSERDPFLDKEVVRRRGPGQLEKSPIEVIKKRPGHSLVAVHLPARHSWPFWIVGGWLFGVAVKSSQAWFKRMLVEFVREVNIYDAGRARRILESKGIEALQEEIVKIRNDSVRSTYERVLRQAGQAHGEKHQP